MKSDDHGKAAPRADDSQWVTRGGKPIGPASRPPVLNHTAQTQAAGTTNVAARNQPGWDTEGKPLTAAAAAWTLYKLGMGGRRITDRTGAAHLRHGDAPAQRADERALRGLPDRPRGGLPRHLAHRR